MRPGPLNLITDVPGIALGNAEAPDYGTGTTVILPDIRAVAAADVRGGGPGTREITAIEPDALNERVDAIVLSGGSAWGLEAASGVMEWLRDQGRGLAVRDSLVPIVPAAILFDLPQRRDPSAPGETLPYRALGRAAAAAAGARFALGTAGAGYGATTAGLKGGLGSASLVWQREGAAALTVGAVVAVNALGSALIPGTRAFLAAPWEIDGEFGGLAMPPHAPWPTAIPSKRPVPGANTTIAAVATDASLTKAQARRLAIMAQDGLSRALHPAHTPFDGDTVFALSTGREAGIGADELYILGTMAATCLSRAIARGVYEATAISDLPAWRDL
ncbi:P1 family peptidase [Paroceanicella profunda]|uniref:P1 family peptidase n=1 Tax=Paroceanicella profunda TaxID=2579971 RepID=A0A5B8FG19_9RHOB|nr:P1 family peptidase [Paroceanicella profunda]QDL90681.1 P1 family peptidase [Paroceanicella profunda]